AARTGSVRGVGWEANVQSLRAALHLPPGWSLLAAGGVDRSPSSWTARWTLFGFFLVLLVSVAAGKLAGWRSGLVALAALVLCYREPGAPELVWVSLLASGALLAVARGRLLTLVKVWWGVSAVALLVVALPFFLEEVRGGLYPQARGGYAVSEGLVGIGGEEKAMLQTGQVMDRMNVQAAPTPGISARTKSAEVQSSLNE